MREILFRGKDEKTGKIIFGDLRHFNNEVRIVGKSGYSHIVEPETIGQFTGLADKKGVKIFEGDILLFGDKSFAVEWKNDIVGFGYFYTFDRLLGCDGINCEVIGNIHENPEKLI